MEAIFLKELRDFRWLFWAVAASVAATAILPEDYAVVWAVFLVYFLLPMLCAFLGSRILSADLSDDQLPFILTLPMSRTHLWLAKAGAGILLTLGLTVAGILAGAFAANGNHPPSTDGIRLVVGIMCLGFLGAYALAASFSVMCDRPLTAAFLAYCVGVLGFLTNLMFIERHVRWAAQRAMSSSIVFLLVFGLILLLLRGSLYVFQTADLLDRRDRMTRALLALGLAVLVFEGTLASYVGVLLGCVSGR